MAIFLFKTMQVRNILVGMNAEEQPGKVGAMINGPTSPC